MKRNAEFFVIWEISNRIVETVNAILRQKEYFIVKLLCLMTFVVLVLLQYYQTMAATSLEAYRGTWGRGQGWNWQPKILF